MCDKLDNGKTRVINKGADVAVFAGSASAAEAMKASRILAVKGISTAVIEVLTIEPIDKKTLADYAQKTGAIVFTEQYIYEAAAGVLQELQSVTVENVKEPTAPNIIKAAADAVKLKLRK